MKEQTMCCGTTCDKNKVAEYIAKLEYERGVLMDAISRIKDAESNCSYAVPSLCALQRAIDEAPSSLDEVVYE